MEFNKDEVQNLIHLLLHEDAVNVEIALALLDQAILPVDNQILYALNIVTLLLSPANVSAAKRKDPSMKARMQLQQTAEKQLARLLKASPQLGNMDNFHKDIYILALAAAPPDGDPWKRWFNKYKTKRKHYEPLLLDNAAWHNAYFALAIYFYQQKEYWLCIDFIDALLRVLPNNHNCGMYRYNAVHALLERGEAHEEIPKQIDFAKKALLSQAPETFCMYNVLIANNYYFHYKDNTRAEEYYREALQYQQGDAKFGKSRHSALASNNLSSIILARDGDKKEAYKLILQANSLYPNSPDYLDALAHFEWLHNNNPNAAKDIFRRALALNEYFVPALAHLAELLVRENQAAAAMPLISTLLNLDNDKLRSYREASTAALQAFAEHLTLNKSNNSLLSKVIYRLEELKLN